MIVHFTGDFIMSNNCVRRQVQKASYSLQSCSQHFLMSNLRLINHTRKMASLKSFPNAIILPGLLSRYFKKYLPLNNMP
ncbi:hypothetical protein EUGRSUZ_I02670 [Eucalyptus grandis]|uniref:Uncharacterized protein n=2 Tax=Eucalyptus grandis TaxID=71139 RepID=A0ACC3JJQ3_EUCGR|nr:hypothetical protein EUGRSUZ_I02670 [Eucalyptus grandis]